MQKLLSDYQGNKMEWFERKTTAKVSFSQFYLRHKNKTLKKSARRFQVAAISIMVIHNQTHLLIVSVPWNSHFNNTGPIF